MRATEQTEHNLWVVESNGGPRSGKGTITSGLAASFPGAAQDETGADYRAVTFGMIRDEIIDPEMSGNRIGKIVKALSRDTIAAYAAQRYEIVAEAGEPALYTPEVNDTVKWVSPHNVVRGAVKEGFRRRLKRQADDPDVHFLFVDGRNLTPVIKKVKGAQPLLRLFVECHPMAATQREAARAGVDLNDPENDDWFRKTLAGIQERKRVDEERTSDPVLPDNDKINYWFNSQVSDETAERLALQLKIPFSAAAKMITRGEGMFRKGGRQGAGAKAYAENRQIYFDTTEIGREAMVANARNMVEEALDQAAGLYVPVSNRLFLETA